MASNSLSEMSAHSACVVDRRKRLLTPAAPSRALESNTIDCIAHSSARMSYANWRDASSPSSVVHSPICLRIGLCHERVGRVVARDDVDHRLSAII